MLDNAARLITDAFDWSTDFAGVDGCVGVEFPLTLPPALVAKNVSLLDAYTGRVAHHSSRELHTDLVPRGADNCMRARNASGMFGRIVVPNFETRQLATVLFCNVDLAKICAERSRLYRAFHIPCALSVFSGGKATHFYVLAVDKRRGRRPWEWQR